MSTLLAAAVCFAAGADFFTPIVLNDIEIGAINPYTGRYATNFRLLDMNQDGVPDLAFTDHVRLQENGDFPETAAIPFPSVPEAPVVEAYQGRLYFKQARSIRVYELQNRDWAELPAIQTPWHHPVAIETPQGKEWGAFILDLDGDGKPEFLHLDRGGLDILRPGGSDAATVERVNVVPIPALAHRASPRQSERRAAYVPPEFELSFHCILDRNRINTVERRPAMETMRRYTVRQFTVTPAGIETRESLTSAPVPDTVQPCLIDADGQIDFAGGMLRYQSNTAVTAPLYEFVLSTDGGRTQRTFHSRSFMPHTYFLDYNRDGLKDILLEETGLGDGGLRQTVSRLATQRKIRHGVHIYQQRPDGTFPASPTISKEFHIRLDKSPIRKSTMFQRYQNGFLVNAIGNINGDGFTDLVVQVAPDRLEIYFGSISDYVLIRRVELIIPPEARFHVLDVNGDGYDDIVVSTPSTDPAREEPENTVYLAADSGRIQ
jgi:FG-GAP repeat